MIRYSTLLFLVISISSFGQVSSKAKPLRIGIAGLTHTHVHWIFNSAKAYPEKIQIVGIAESNRELAERYLKQYSLSAGLLYASLDEMITKAHPEAVTAFNSIAEHLAVVQACAPKNIHVMVEKPLAVSLEHALEMADLAKRYGIHVLTNYETTWYGSNHQVFSLISQEKVGTIRKIVVHDGHPGPKEIGVNKEFLAWLTDPIQNGGGAIMDFGCYGADLITWLMNGERPLEVMAVTQQLKPDVYPKVDDEATIILTYKEAQGIIQASWNWPYNRKDIEIYGQHGYFKADRSSLLFRNGDEPETSIPVVQLEPPMTDPFLYLAAVIRGSITVSDTDLSALKLNMTAMEILEAAKKSAAEGKKIALPVR